MHKYSFVCCQPLSGNCVLALILGRYISSLQASSIFNYDNYEFPSWVGVGRLGLAHWVGMSQVNLNYNATELSILLTLEK